MPPAVKVMLAINVVVFVVWLASGSSPALRRFMVLDFLVSPAHLAHGRVWTLLTSVFSHASLWHLLFNMVVLVSFGRMLEWMMGTRRFILFYLGAGIFSSLSHCLTSALVLGKPEVSALGASGALSAILIVFALRFPREKILIFGIIPIPAMVGALAFVALDLWGLTAQAHGGGLPIGHGAHLGGTLFGLLVWFGGMNRFLGSSQPGAPPASSGRTQPVWHDRFPPPPLTR